MTPGADAPLGRTSGPLGQADAARPQGVRVVLDARPLQEPDRAPITAAYLDGLLGAFDREPLAGESFALLLRSDLDDPTTRYEHLDVVGRRLLPPTRLLRSGALTVDPILLRGAMLGAAWRAERGGAAGAVYHTVGAGPLPLASRLPTVATVLDLAPWELPGAFHRSTAARFGLRLRAQLLREAAAVIVAGEGAAAAVRRLLHIRPDRIHVVPLAPRDAFVPDGARGATKAVRLAAEREQARLGLGERYFVYPGRYDVRQDLAGLLQALAILSETRRPTRLAKAVAWPPKVVLIDASPEDRASLARTAARLGVGESIAYAPALSLPVLAGLVRGARAAILPMQSESTGLAAIEAIACGTPVIAAAVGVLPDIVGTAGILVERGDPGRLATALSTMWTDSAVQARISEAAAERARGDRRTWADVARATREIYAGVGIRRP